MPITLRHLYWCNQLHPDRYSYSKTLSATPANHRVTDDYVGQI